MNLILKTTFLLLFFKFGFSQEITKKGNFRVLYPTKSEKLELEIIELIDKRTSKPFEISEEGAYTLVSDKREEYKIHFEIDNHKNLIGKIIIANYRPGDSIIIEQKNSKFISKKEYLNRALKNELSYVGDSTFIYKDYFSNARYEGKTKLTQYGFTNIENKKYDQNNSLVEHQYFNENIHYTDNFKNEKLIKRKFIANNEKIILNYQNGKMLNKFIYQTLDAKIICLFMIKKTN